MSQNHNVLAGVEPIPLGNVELAWDGERLVIVVGCQASRRAAAYPSESGKTRVLASTRGFVPVEAPAALAGLRLQLTLTLPAGRAPAAPKR